MPELMEDVFRDLASRYQGAESDPGLSYDDPTAYPQASFAPPTPTLSSRFYDPSGNFQFMAPNLQHPANQPQPEMLSGIQRIRSLAQLAPLLKQLQGAPDELKNRILSAATGIQIAGPRAQQLENALMQMRMKREMEAPDRAERVRQQRESLDLRRQQLEDARLYRKGLVDQGTRFSAMMLKYDIDEQAKKLNSTLSSDPHYPQMVKDLQDSIQEFHRMAKGFAAAPESATRGAAAGKQDFTPTGGTPQRPTSGTLNIGGKQVQWTRGPEEGE